jgi:hypothetical protein
MRPERTPSTPLPRDLEGLARLTATRPYFLRSEAIALGVSDKAMRAMTRSGLIRRVRHGTYVVAAGWDALTSDEQHVVRGRAAMGRLQGVALSHVTAALAHGMDVWGMDLELVHVTRLDGGAGRTEAGVRHHESFTASDDLVEIDGHRAVTPVRAALETALLGGVERGLVTVDSGLRQLLFTPDDVNRQARLMRSWPGALPVQLVRRLANPLSESVAESRCWHVFWLLALPAPQSQYAVHDATGAFIGRVDFAWPEFRLIVEFDGAVKYDGLLRPGETANQVVIREKRREDRLRAAGWTVIRLCWSDLENPARLGALLRSHMTGLDSVG